MIRLLLFILGTFIGTTVQNIGRCDLSQVPHTWLSTNATGILDYATAGQPTNGTNFCVERNAEEKTLKVAYHIKVDEASEVVQSQFGEYKNNCVNKNERVVYCWPFCFNETLQSMVIDSALKSNQPVVVANDLEKTLATDWAITVMQVDYTDPKTHLNASQFIDPAAWCSVYIGIRPKLAFDYLYEIQLGRLIQ